jgi:hypothetical protein
MNSGVGQTARIMALSAFALLAVILYGGSLSTALAQGSGDRAIDQAQRHVRQRIIAQEGGSNLTVPFNTDAQTDFQSRTEVRVRGTGSFSRSTDSRYKSTVETAPIVSRLDLNGFSPRPSLSAPSELLLGSGRVG